VLEVVATEDNGEVRAGDAPALFILVGTMMIDDASPETCQYPSQFILPRIAKVAGVSKQHRR
jgi:hypothetical protein